jgi:hypothetical protein
MKSNKIKKLVLHLSGVCHEALAPEGGLLEEPGQGARMVQVEVGDQQQVDLHDRTCSLDNVYGQIFSIKKPIAEKLGLKGSVSREGFGF